MNITYIVVGPHGAKAHLVSCWSTNNPMTSFAVCGVYPPVGWYLVGRAAGSAFWKDLVAMRVPPCEDCYTKHAENNYNL